MRPKLNDLKKIKVGAVSYLNTKPLLYGIKHHPIIEQIDLIEDYPSKIAEMLLQDRIDVGLVPVAVIPKLKEHFIITDYCIGAEGEVASVCIFSEVPIDEVESVLLDYQSRTSVALAQLLLKEYWKKDVQFINATGEDYRKKIIGTTAGVVIGDRALEQRSISKYIYDLGAAWHAYTGLPFVFAAWVSNKQLPTEFIEGFNKANELGLKNLQAVVNANPFAHFDLKKYYERCISYKFDDKKKRGLERFLSSIPVAERRL